MARRRDDESDLSMTDPQQVAALRSVVFSSARATGLDRDRARAVADNFTSHAAGRLRRFGPR